MELNKIQELLQSKFGGAILETAKEGWVKIVRESLLAIVQFLKTEPELGFDFLHCITGVDLGGGTLQCVYTLTSTTQKHWLSLKVEVKADDPHIPTLCHLWPTANWHEREAFDLFGLSFTGHPNLKRILCHEDWVGHPLRKDYEFPKTFEGIPGDVLQEEEDTPMPRTSKKG